MEEKKSLLSKPNVKRIDLPKIENTVSREDFLRGIKDNDKDQKTYAGVRLTRNNTRTLNVLTKMKKHSSVNDLITAILEVYIIEELTEEELENFKIMLKYMN